MGIKLPWFRARMNVKDEGHVKNTQLIGTYSYKYDSHFDSNACSKLNALDIADEKEDKAKNSRLKDKKLAGNKNKNKSEEKQKSSTEPNSIIKISEKQSSLEENKTKVSYVPEKNITNAGKKAVKKPKRAVVKVPDQHFTPTTKERVQQTSSKDINNKYASLKKDEEKLSPETGITSHQFNAENDSNVSKETPSENKTKADKENEIPLKNNQSSHQSNEGKQKSLRERRIPHSALKQLTIIIPDNVDEFEDDFISPVLDDCHAYDEFDS